VAELDRRGIVTKRRDTKVAKYNGAIPFTYGPLAYLLKNRVYIGEVHHGGKWYKGEQKAILDQQIFERVQALLKANANGSKVKHFDSGALLRGKLYDDKDNLMGPSFSSKNGVRYRFYVSSALLRGRKAGAGSVGRVSAALVENAVVSALATHQQTGGFDDAVLDIALVQRVVIARDRLLITLPSRVGNNAKRDIRIPWSNGASNSAVVADRENATEGVRSESLIQAIVRAHAWLQQLVGGTHASVEDLAGANSIHAKVVRQSLRFAYLSPEITSAILEGRQSPTLTLALIPKLLPLAWATQRQLLG
jgi:site-specific DNA recombinase